MVVLQSSVRRFACLTLLNKYRPLKENDTDQSCITTAKIFDFAKSTVSHSLKKKAEIIEAVEGKHASKKRKRRDIGTYKELGLLND